MKMSDVFNKLVVKRGRDIDTSEVHFENGGLVAVFYNMQGAHHATHAINNHDRLTSDVERLTLEKLAEVNARHYEVDSLRKENERLLDMLKRLTSHDNCRKDVIHLMSEADSLIQELEQKGAE